VQLLWAVNTDVQTGGRAEEEQCVLSNRSQLPNPLSAVSCIFRFSVPAEDIGESRAAIQILFWSVLHPRSEGEREKERKKMSTEGEWAA